MIAIDRRSTGARESTVYEVRTGRILLEGENLALLPSGRLALAGATGKAVALVDLQSGTRRELPGAMHAVHPLGDRIGWNRQGDEIVSWDLTTGRRLASMPAPPHKYPAGGAHRPSFAAASPRPDGRTLAWLDARFHLHLLDLEAGESRAVIPGGPRELPNGLLLSRDGKRALATGSKDTLVLFDLEAGGVIARQNKLPLPRQCAWLADGRLVMEGAFLDVIDPKTGARRVITGRDPNREAIAAIIAAGATTVLVLVQRIANPKEPFLTDWFWEAWDVDAGKRRAARRADEATAPVRLSEKGRLFCARDATGDDYVARSSWMAFALTGLDTRSTRSKPGASARAAGASRRGRAPGRARSGRRRPPS